MKLYVVAQLHEGGIPPFSGRLTIESTHETKKSAHARGKALRAEGADVYVYEAATFERLTGVKL